MLKPHYTISLNFTTFQLSFFPLLITSPPDCLTSFTLQTLWFTANAWTLEELRFAELPPDFTLLTLAKLPGKTSLQVLPAKGINSSLFIYNLYHWEHNYRFFFPLHKYTIHAPTSVYLTQNSQIVKQNPTQDTTGLDNCRPVSRLILISKITHKTTAYQLFQLVGGHCT